MYTLCNGILEGVLDFVCTLFDGISQWLKALNRNYGMLSSLGSF